MVYYLVNELFDLRVDLKVNAKVELTVASKENSLAGLWVVLMAAKMVEVVDYLMAWRRVY